MNRRMGWLLLLLTAMLAATFWPQGEEREPEVVEAARRQTLKPPPDSPAGPKGHPVATVARVLGPLKANLFPPQSWKPPPPPPPPVLRMPPPSPPPMPFRYMGRWTEPQGMVVFLTQGENVFLVRKGDTLSGVWRVDDISQGQMDMTYLPMNKQQTLRIVP